MGVWWKSFLANPPENKWSQESSEYLNFFFKGQIWHSQAEEIWHLYVLLMKLVPLKCALPPRFTTWHLQTCQLDWQCQGEIKRFHAMGSDVFFYPTTLASTLPTGGLQWTLQLNKWVNQPTNQTTPNKSQTLWKFEEFQIRIMFIHFSLSLRNWMFFSHWIKDNRSKYSSSQRKLR